MLVMKCLVALLPLLKLLLEKGTVVTVGEWVSDFCYCYVCSCVVTIM